jgi:hypothetical protein
MNILSLGANFFRLIMDSSHLASKDTKLRKNATAEFLPLRSKAWNKPYQSLRWSGSKFGSDTHFTCSQCAPKNTPKDFWWSKFQPLHHCSAQPGRKKVASVQFITLDLCRLRWFWWIYCLLLDVYTCSLQPLGLPAANPAYPLTCQIPSQGLSFSFSKTP